MNRALTFGGRRIAIHVLGQALDDAFDEFYASRSAGQSFDFTALNAAARAYFSRNPTSPDAHNAYFENFSPIWRTLLDSQQYPPAEQLWERALEPALAWERANPGNRLHKGTPYYFWAMTVILRRDMDRGYLIMHRAVEEDIVQSGQQAPDTPAYALVSLNHEKVDQAFRACVVAQAQYVERLLSNYNTTHQRTLTTADLKQRFLTVPPTIDVLFLLTYTLARLINVADVPDHARMNTFAGQLGMNLFFDITLIIDATIKAKTQQRYFIEHAKSLLAAAGTPLTKQQLQDTNSQFCDDFDDTLKSAVDGTLAVSGTALDKLQCDVALAYGLRNNGAHNTSAAETVWQRFPDVEQALFRVLFAAIDHLY